MNYQKTYDFLIEKINIKPLVALILGTGLGGLADEVQNQITIPYKDIPDFPISTAPSHHGELVAGTLGNVPVIVFKGRVHLYEGYNVQQIVYSTRVAKLLGVKYLFVTNAAGSLNIDLKPGSLVRIKDHINFTGTNPCIGQNTLPEKIIIDGVEKAEFGDRFPSLHETYDTRLAEIADKIAKENNIDLKSGVYCGLPGPSFETRAECQMFRSWGADLVGMSTVPEVIAAVHCGLKVFAVSVVTNYGNIFHRDKHNQENIGEKARIAAVDLALIFKKLLSQHIKLIN